jgi:arabinose-5-phosphate isomerase
MTSAPSAARLKRAGKKRAKAQPKVALSPKGHAAKVVQVAGRRPAGSPDIEVGRRVLLMEANGLAALAAGLDGNFSKAVDILMTVSRKGAHARAIISGMGKSGHVARKIAATLASTGTPASFVHPGEASHGDLGMIMPGDVVICLSNSGETQELADVIAHAKRFAIPLIAMTKKAKSALGEAADVLLLVPPVEEACPIAQAPTTSTTMMLALGDALAVALMERRGFTKDQFRVFHPGGKLGKQLIKVKDLMHTGAEMPMVPSGTPMREALVTMAGRSFGCIGIIGTSGKEKDRLLGIITDGDLRRHIEGDLLNQNVDAVMTKKPITIGPNQLAGEALGEMNRRRITAFFVVDGSRPVGILHMHDCVRAGIT